MFNEFACSGSVCTSDYYEEDLYFSIPSNYAPGQEFTFNYQSGIARDYAIKAVVEPGYYFMILPACMQFLLTNNKFLIDL